MRNLWLWTIRISPHKSISAINKALVAWLFEWQSWSNLLWRFWLGGVIGNSRTSGQGIHLKHVSGRNFQLWTRKLDHSHFNSGRMVRSPLGFCGYGNFWTYYKFTAMMQAIQLPGAAGWAKRCALSILCGCDLGGPPSSSLKFLTCFW